MTTRVQKWGNSLAIRIPRAFAEELGVREDSPINLKLQEGTMVVSAQTAKIPTLEELVAGITEENRHPELDWGPPVGREVW